MSFSYEELAEIRHYIHQHPELSGQEYQTTAFLKERLEEFGIRILESGLKTGLIAEIGSGQPVVALRADIDALPILEQTNLPYQSQNPGVMHACGHDFHQTSLLGAAALLKEKEDQLEGTVRLIFQPAEEISEGASDVLATGLLEDVQGIIGFHNIPQLKAGQLALNAGAMMAGVEKFKVTVTGVSSHAARPDLGVDTVTAVTTMVQNLQLLISRTVSPFETAVLSITHLDVGSTWNVLPKSGYFEGTKIRKITDIAKLLVASENFTKRARGEQKPLTYSTIITELEKVWAIIKREDTTLIDPYGYDVRINH